MKVVTFGEILLRLASPGYTKLFQKDYFEFSFCGAEANVAVSLATLGIEAEFVTKVPKNDVGIASINSLRYFGVHTENIVYGGNRLGIYYLEKGASQRPSKVIYDRTESSIAQAINDDFNWDKIFDGADLFHWSGINPALSDNLMNICLAACKKAKEKGIIISCDLNYRGKLWSPAQAQAVMPTLMKYVDICVANEEDAEKALGISVIGSNVEAGKLGKASYVQTAEALHDLYGFKYIAITLRKSISASMNGWSALLYCAEKRKAYFSKEYEIQLVDRVGGGDSFAAGLIYGLLKKMPVKNVIEFATAASCLKQTMEGDFNRASLEDILSLMNSSGSGRVQR